MTTKFLNKKRNIVLAVIISVIVVVLVLAAMGAYKLYKFRHPADASEYSAVYLKSGDIYFGKLDWLPWPRIKNPWILQKTQDGGVNVVPFASVFWSPVDMIYLNPKEVTFWTYLKSDSNIVKALRNPASVQAASPANPNPVAPDGKSQQPAASSDEKAGD